MDYSFSWNKDLFFRAIDLMQSLLSPGDPPNQSGHLFAEYSISDFIYDVETCEQEEETILASNSNALFETAIRRKMPTIWLVKTRHPVFAVYAAICNRIDKPINTASYFIGETDFPKLTKFGKKFVQAPLHVVGIEEQNSLSSVLERLPTSKRPWTVLCNWRFDTWDTAVADAYETDREGCVLRPR